MLGVRTVPTVTFLQWTAGGAHLALARKLVAAVLKPEFATTLRLRTAASLAKALSRKRATAKPVQVRTVRFHVSYMFWLVSICIRSHARACSSVCTFNRKF